MTRPTALVTGASSGIGRELSKLLAADGHDLVVVARRRERLEELGRELSARHAVSVRAIAEDLSDRGASARIAAELAAERIAPDVLVNNAGFGLLGRFWETDLDRQLEMIQVNVAAVTDLTGRLLPGMVERGRGRVVNIASTAAFQPGPLMAVYYASKAFVLSFSEALAVELHGTGVTVTAVCPGPVVTEFQEVAGLTETRLFHSPFVMDVARVARIGYEGARRGKSLVIPGWGNRLLASAVRFMPRRLVAEAAGRFQKTRTQRAR